MVPVLPVPATVKVNSADFFNAEVAVVESAMYIVAVPESVIGMSQTHFALVAL